MRRYFLFLTLVLLNVTSKCPARVPNFATDKNAKIYVAGHKGLVGSAIVRKLKAEGYRNIVVRSSRELDLCNQRETNEFFVKEKPAYVFVAAAKVGGIVANDRYSADFIYNNMMIEANIIRAAHDVGVKKLLFLGSSCIYPRNCPQPMKEEYLLTGELEKTNAGYAIAKIAGLKLCELYRKQYGDNFISCMPTNLYGPGDNFHLTNSHVLPALIFRINRAKELNAPYVAIWGTGSAYREFLHVDDCADAIIFLMKNYNGSTHVNIGTGTDLTIKELAEMVKAVVGYRGKLVFDTSKPDGTPKKLLDVSKIHALGWKHKIELRQGIEETYNWFLQNRVNLRRK